jgi:hypothetical protein
MIATGVDNWHGIAGRGEIIGVSSFFGKMN